MGWLLGLLHVVLKILGWLAWLLFAFCWGMMAAESERRYARALAKLLRNSWPMLLVCFLLAILLGASLHLAIRWALTSFVTFPATASVVAETAVAAHQRKPGD